MSDIITINDTVKVKYKNSNGVNGVVRFIGEIPHKTGTFYGIDLNSQYNADTDDMAFFKRTQLHLLEQSDMIRVTVGDIVNVTKYSSHGIVRFIGETKFKPDNIWYGIQLEQALGKNNGTIKGQKYFVCEPKYGIFVQSNYLELIKHKKIKTKKKKHKKKKSSTISRGMVYNHIIETPAKPKTYNMRKTDNNKKIEEITLTTQQSIDDDVKMAVKSMKESEIEFNENNMVEMGMLMHCEYKSSITMGVYGYYYRTILMPIQYQPSASTGVYGGYCVTYDVFEALFPMPQNYKPSASTGIYGVYPIMDKKRMPQTYKPSFNTGIYGNYTVNDDKMVCKYVNKEDLQYWSNRVAPPDLTYYSFMRKHEIDEDEIAEQMFKDEIAAYWINRFFIDGYVSYNYM